MYESIGVGEALLIALCGFVTVFLLLLFLIAIVMIVSRVIVAIEGKGKSAAVAAPAPTEKPAAPAKKEEPSLMLTMRPLLALWLSSATRLIFRWMNCSSDAFARFNMEAQT